MAKVYYSCTVDKVLKFADYSNASIKEYISKNPEWNPDDLMSEFGDDFEECDTLWETEEYKGNNKVEYDKI